MDDEEKERLKKQQELDQSMALMAELMPPLYARMWRNLKAEGFSEEQAFKLLLVYVNATCGGKFSPY